MLLPVNRRFETESHVVGDPGAVGLANQQRQSSANFFEIFLALGFIEPLGKWLSKEFQPVAQVSRQLRRPRNQLDVVDGETAPV